MDDKTALTIGSTLFVLGTVGLFFFGENNKRAQLEKDLGELKKRIDALENRPRE